MPFLVSLVIVFLLSDLVEWLHQRLHLPYRIAALLVFLLFLGILLVGMVFLLPPVVRQLQHFAAQIVPMINFFNRWFQQWALEYPQFFAQQGVTEALPLITRQLGNLSQDIVTTVLVSFDEAITYLLYFVLVPVIVFFLLIDKHQLVHTLVAALPHKRNFLHRVWMQMRQKSSNYVRGKFSEMVIVAVASFMIFFLFQLDFSLLLAILVGLSVIIPYVGAMIVTVPVVLVALFQFGTSEVFWWVVGAYLVLQILDGNVLVPLLFSEAVNLHPLTIILAILIFGSLWGLVGIFFAIPLATFFKVLIYSWPVTEIHHPKIEKN